MLKEGCMFFKWFKKKLELRDMGKKYVQFILIALYLTYETNYNIISRFEIYILWKMHCVWLSSCVFPLC